MILFSLVIPLNFQSCKIDFLIFQAEIYMEKNNDDPFLNLKKKISPDS